MNRTQTKSDEFTLVSKFNDREAEAFSTMYSLLYKELYYFSSKLYRNTGIDSEDIIQDIFADIWQKKNLKFNTYSDLRAYIFVIIKNKYKRYYNREKLTNKIKSDISYNEDYFIFKAVESEIYSLIPEALKLLPAECAKSLKMYLDGYEVKEIAEKLGKKSSTIYNQKKEAISILSKKLPKNRMLTILSIFIK